ncbi:MAG: hypothetical protein R3B96_19645 [Pirellulaceae bacterium]
MTGDPPIDKRTLLVHSQVGETGNDDEKTARSQGGLASRNKQILEALESRDKSQALRRWRRGSDEPNRLVPKPCDSQGPPSR